VIISMRRHIRSQLAAVNYCPTPSMFHVLDQKHIHIVGHRNLFNPQEEEMGSWILSTNRRKPSRSHLLHVVYLRDWCVSAYSVACFGHDPNRRECHPYTASLNAVESKDINAGCGRYIKPQKSLYSSPNFLDIWTISKASRYNDPNYLYTYLLTSHLRYAK